MSLKNESGARHFVIEGKSLPGLPMAPPLGELAAPAGDA